MIGINWQQIDQVFLDLDGTLLDLHFDNYFWQHYVPQRYAKAQGVSFAEAKAMIFSRYRDIEGSLNWYCVDHWSCELGLDIALLKQEVQHLIQVHPHVIDFLQALAHAGKRRVLVTNAHQKSLQLKLERTQLGGHLDQVICAHDLGLPKEEPRFWQQLQALVTFDPTKTLFVDDNPAVLLSAQQAGFHWLLCVSRPDSKRPVRASDSFDSIQDFSVLIPQLQRFKRSL